MKIHIEIDAVKEIYRKPIEDNDGMGTNIDELKRRGE